MTSGAIVGPTVLSSVTQFDIATSLASNPGVTYDFGGPITAQYIRIDMDTNWEEQNSYVGLSEVQFNTASVPEPSSMSLMALGGLALLRRRRA